MGLVLQKHRYKISQMTRQLRPSEDYREFGFKSIKLDLAGVGLYSIFEIDAFAKIDGEHEFLRRNYRFNLMDNEPTDSLMAYTPLDEPLYGEYVVYFWSSYADLNTAYSGLIVQADKWSDYSKTIYSNEYLITPRLL